MVDKHVQQGSPVVRQAVLVLALLLAGCSAESIRNKADEQMRTGHYEQALQTYDQGLARYPESVVLRSGRVVVQTTILSQLIEAAARQRATGHDDQAEATLRRATKLYPSEQRPRDALLEVARDRRHQAVLREAKDLAAKGLKERALLLTETALKENPSSPELLELRRQLETDAPGPSLAAGRLSETRPVSLDFKDAGLRSVLDVVTRTSGINFVIDKDVRQDLQCTVYLRRASVQDALDLLTSSNQLTYKVLDTGTVLIYPRTPDKLKEYQDLIIRAFYLSNADVKQTGTLLKTMLKIRDPFVDEKLNLIVIREPAETVRLAERLVALQDVAQPEVLMEVEVLEIKNSALTELGINYPDSVSLTPLIPQGAASLTLGNLKNLSRDAIGVSLPGAQLNLHRDVDGVHILANPKIRARNHEKAHVLIGDKLPVITTTGTASNNGFISESVQYVDVGLKLDVEPDIYLDDEVAIKVGLEVSSLVREIKTSAGSLVYQIGTRAANTVLRLRDGESQLLAGLVSNEERSSANRIPGLGDLPVLGRLFASQRDDTQRTEVVLSITPHIVRNIRRPDLPAAEFWSGTENDIRSRPLPGVHASTPRTAPIDPSLAPPATQNSAPQSRPNVWVSMAAPESASVGETVAVNIGLRSEIALRGMPIELEFPSTNLQFLDATPDEFFAQNNGAINVSQKVEPGRLTVTLLRGVPSGATGAGHALTLRFKALAPGVAEVRLVGAKPIALDPFVQAPLPEPGRITIR